MSLILVICVKFLCGASKLMNIQARARKEQSPLIKMILGKNQGKAGVPMSKNITELPNLKGIEMDLFQPYKISSKKFNMT